MLRLAEVALLLAPVIAFVVWRVMAPSGGPSRAVLAGAACALAVLLGALIWLRRQEALPPNQAYVPAQMLDGRIVPGHGSAR